MRMVRVVVLMVGLSLAPGAGAATYYVNAQHGDDGNAGTSPEAAWRSIERVNKATLAAGDTVRLAGGQRFGGTLRFGDRHCGTKDRPITVGSFGDGRATIDGGAGDGFVLTGSRYVKVRELNVVGCGRKNGSNGSGICLTNTRNVELDGIEASGFRTAGVATGGDENTRITHVWAHDNGFAGICTFGGEDGVGRSRNLYIGLCKAENNPGDPNNLTNHSGNGIVVGGLDGGLIEYCEATNNGWDMPRRGNGPVGIWGWNCDRLTIQHCISHDNKTAPGAVDGGGFDLDGGATRSILQYNLSYHNHGCGYLLCQYPGAATWKDNICRYNISIDDGQTNHFSGIYFWAGGEGISDAQVYNNLIINRAHAVCSTHDIAGLVFRNNIFVAGGDIICGPLSRSRFECNLYWSTGAGGVCHDGQTTHATLGGWARTTGQETVEGRLVGLFADPQLVLPLRGEPLPTDPQMLAAMRFYRLRAGSPAIGAGTIIADSGGRDLFGHAVPNDRRPSIGACEASGQD
jgi:hypothetical protein